MGSTVIYSENRISGSHRTGYVSVGKLQSVSVCTAHRDGGSRSVVNSNLL